MKNAPESVPLPGPAYASAEADGPDDSTRQRVQQSIMQFGPSTAGQLAERLELTPAAIRRHLGVLLDRGHVVSREQRSYGGRGRGRPAKVFALTDAGRASFHQAYDDLAIRAIAHLAHAGGAEALDDLARSRVARVESRYRQIRAEAPGRSAAGVLAEALTEDGYVASITPAPAGDQLCQHHCPIAHVAAEFPQLCEMETKVFSQLLDVHVQRLATIARGDGVCTTHIPTRPSPSGTTRPDRRSHADPHLRQHPRKA